MPGRKYNIANTNYSYGFNGKENDNEVKGEGNQQDYGMRIYDPRLVRFLSVDPISKNFPELTPYQFASNSPISGIDLDGLEYYYASDGSLLFKWGNSTQVKLLDAEFVKSIPSSGKVAVSNLNNHSRDVGMTNEELNTRAFMSTLKQTENSGEKALPYNAWNGFKKNNTPQTFTDKSYEETPEKYDDHPGANPNHGNRKAAGTYQIMFKPTWTDKSAKYYKSLYGIKNFSPNAQDKFILATIKDKRKALTEVMNGDIDAAISKLSLEWRSLPGPKTQSTITTNKVKILFKQNVSNELNGNSNISLPKGKTLDGFQ